MLFDHEAYDKFFHPLCCKNKKIYYACILQLIEKSKSVSLLYETDARDTLILYFRNCAYAVEEEEISDNVDERISSSKTESENAGAVLRYFRQCGWISEKELGRNGDAIATVEPHCRKMIDAIEKIFHGDNTAALTNHIFAIYDILNTVYVADHGRTHRPYSNILSPLTEHMLDLKNELQDLSSNIHSIIRTVIRLTETNKLGQFLIKDEMLDKFFNDYFFIKKDGVIPGYIAEIERMLRKIPETDVYENMIKEYHGLHGVDIFEAREKVESQLAQVRGFISYDYVREMNYIDKKINSYYSLYATRIRMVLSGGVNLQANLNALLMHLKNSAEEDRKKILEEVSECFMLRSYRYVGRKSITRRKKRRPNLQTGAIMVDVLSEEEREKMTNELLHGYPDRYGVKQTAEYLDNILAERESIVPNQTMIRTREDAMMIAASIIYSGSFAFPYEVEFLEGTLETAVATISKIRIRRKKENADGRDYINNFHSGRK